jgi:hypothetical protein
VKNTCISAHVDSPTVLLATNELRRFYRANSPQDLDTFKLRGMAWDLVRSLQHGRFIEPLMNLQCKRNGGNLVVSSNLFMRD